MDWNLEFGIWNLEKGVRRGSEGGEEANGLGDLRFETSYRRWEDFLKRKNVVVGFLDNAARR